MEWLKQFYARWNRVSPEVRTRVMTLPDVAAALRAEDFRNGWESLPPEVKDLCFFAWYHIQQTEANEHTQILIPILTGKKDDADLLPAVLAAYSANVFVLDDVYGEEVWKEAGGAVRPATTFSIN